MLKRYSGQFWLLSFSSYLFFSSFNMLIPELPGYLSRMGGEEYMGLIISLFTVTAGFSRPFSGKLTDKWGRIPVMVVGAAVSGIAALLYPAFTTVWGFLFIRLFHGFSTGFKPTGTSAYIADIVPANRRGEALGISSFFGSIGMASGPAIGSWVFNVFGINTLFYVSSIFAFASVGILIGMKETLQTKSTFNLSMLKINKNDIFEKNVFPPSIVMILTTLSFGTIITLTPSFSDYLDINNRGLFFIVFTGSSLLVRIVGGQLSDRFGRLSVLRVSTLIMFVSMVVIGLASSKMQFFVGAFLFGLGYGFNSPTLFAWTIDLSSDHNRGKGIATLYIFLEIGIGLGALISGTIYQGFNERFSWIFGVAGLFSLIAFLYIITFKQNKQPQIQ
ncbi:MAG: MFS transporter [Flammeovirgaceae bacterium]|nr:MFS transporter [Flammeovirgaceae bacterium]MBR07493.1 MFS transporter [Rickettsiales bacterium]HCX22862.1 MFS transporter [Cytophagales bacterium]